MQARSSRMLGTKVELDWGFQNSMQKIFKGAEIKLDDQRYSKFLQAWREGYKRPVRNHCKKMCLGKFMVFVCICFQGR